MANCPKCGKPVPWYKSFTHNRWTGVKCSNCGSRLFIRKKDLYGWKTLLSTLIILLLLGSNYYFIIYMRYLINRPSEFVIIECIDVLVLLFIMFVGIKLYWKNIKLEIRDKF